MANLAAVGHHLDAPWVSEHLSYNRVRRDGRVASTGLLLPPVQTAASARVAAAAAVAYRDALGRPFAFETGVNYLAPRPSELTDGAWWRTVAETADCGIVLDLHKVWCNARNGRQPLDGLLDELPLHRVWELHVAGGEQLDGIWLDAHSGLVDADLLDIAAAVVPRLPALRAITFEIVPEHLVHRGIDPVEIRRMLDSLRRIWDLRRPGAAQGTGTAPPSRVGAHTAVADDDEVARAEIALAEAVIGRDGAPEEPGVRVMRQLVESIRRGLSVTVLPLSLRLVRLELGPAAVTEAFEACWGATPPEPHADAEARNLAAVLRERFGELDHLGEVLDFELALVEAGAGRAAPPVRFSCEPLALLGALGRGERPTGLRPEHHELVLT